MNGVETARVAGGDNDGNAGEKEAKDFMEAMNGGKSFEVCWDIGPTVNGYQGEVCVTIRPSNPLAQP
jgi:hypothetical protein